MKTFSITSKNLSELMHIDSSLISKWRSGKRQLKPKSVYLIRIVSYIMELDRQNNFYKICSLLANDFENIHSCPEKEIEIYLKNWLTGEDLQAKKNSVFDPLRYSDSVSVGMFFKFKDENGRRQAVRFQQDYAVQNAPGLEILVYTQEDVSWLYDNEEYLRDWETNVRLSVLKGNSFKIIHPMGRSYENTAISILKWMPLHMTGKTHAFYIPKYTDEPLYCTIFLVPDHMTVFNVSTRHHSKTVNTYLTNDEAILDTIQGAMQEFFDSSIPIFKPFTFKNKSDFLNSMIATLEARKTKYIYCPSFLFLPLSKALLTAVFQLNGIRESEISKYIEQYNILAMLNIRSVTRHFISLEQIRQLLQQDTVVLDSLSFLTGMHISVTHELFSQILREALASILETENLETGITESSTFTDLGAIDVMVQEITCADFFSTEPETALTLVTNELTVLMALFQKFEKLWNAIPRLNRNKDFVVRQITELLDTQTHTD